MSPSVGSLFRVAKKPAKPSKSKAPARKVPAGSGSSSARKTSSRASGGKTAKKAPAKKTAKKAKVAKTAKVAKKASPKATSKAGPGAKATGKASVPPKFRPPKGEPAPTKPAGKGKEAPAQTADAGGKGGRKGITIVSNKPRRASNKPAPVTIPQSEPLLGPGSRYRKPLIPSGPARTRELEAQARAEEQAAATKSPLGKRDLKKFREILLRKRADLVGDVSDLESEALLGRSGSLSSLPQHIAEQGSEAYEQSLSLDLAAEDRRLIREIDGALARIEAGTFGICEHTGRPISRERLDELPWTRYSIEAARDLERRSLGR